MQLFVLTQPQSFVNINLGVWINESPISILQSLLAHASLKPPRGVRCGVVLCYVVLCCVVLCCVVICSVGLGCEVLFCEVSLVKGMHFSQLKMHFYLICNCLYQIVKMRYQLVQTISYGPAQKMPNPKAIPLSPNIKK